MKGKDLKNIKLIYLDLRGINTNCDVDKIMEEITESIERRTIETQEYYKVQPQAKVLKLVVKTIFELERHDFEKIFAGISNNTRKIFSNIFFIMPDDVSVYDGWDIQRDATLPPKSQ